MSSEVMLAGYNGWVKMYLMDPGTPYDSDGESVQNHADKGVLIHVTNATLSRQRMVPTLRSYYLPFEERDEPQGEEGGETPSSDSAGVDLPAKSQIICGDGCFTFSGEISFELTEGASKAFIVENMFKRNSWIAIEIFDQQQVIKIFNCVWENVTISCASNSLVSMSISYQTNNGYSENLQVIPSGDAGITYDENDFLIPYWECGHQDGFVEFSITFSRSVTQVFLNNDLCVASYLRPGLVEITLSATMLDYVKYLSNNGIMEIKIGSFRSISLLWSKLMTMQYNMSSLTDVGVKTYTWNSIANTPDEPIFQINTFGESGGDPPSPPGG